MKLKRNTKKSEPKPKKVRKPGVFTPVVSVLNGNILTREGAVKHLPYLLFLALLCIVYIGNGYFAESAIHGIDSVGDEIKELRSEYITTKSDLMYESKQSQVARIVAEKELGLQESVLPPEKIVVAENELPPQ